MGHLDIRISDNKNPDQGSDAPLKDGATSQPNAQSPKKEDQRNAARERASDVLTGDKPADR